MTDKAQTGFPYAWTEEAGLPGYQRVRAEGLPLGRAIWSGLGYLRKYRKGKRSAPPEEVAYFDGQRRLLRQLPPGPEEGARLALVGDLMWLRDGWNDFLAPEVLAYLNGHDAVLGNLESPISPRFRVPRLLPDYFTYNSDPGLLTSFRRPEGGSTFSALTTPNNHSLDRGDEGLADTLALLDRLGIAHAGVRASPADDPFALFEAGGVKFGLYAACWGLNNPASVTRSAHHIEVFPGLVPEVRMPPDLSRVEAALAGMARAGAEFRIVALHWGHEFEFYPTPRQVQLAREIARAGADLIVGTHPHVIQPLEVCFVNGYEERYRRQGLDSPATQGPTGALVRDGTGVPRKALVAYSLGNFATAMYTLHCRVGLILSLRLARDAETGRIDWHRPEPQLVYNAHRDPATRRRCLALVETYLRDRERRGDDAPPLRRMAEWLRRHLLGGD
jgi:poly-gamma-glutamate synthesis protein (capsule biosynthesis protein)